MTAPAFVARGTATNANPSSLAGSLPTGSGGHLVATVQRNSGVAVNSIPALWSELLDNNDTANNRVGVYVCDARGGDPATVTWGFASAANATRITIARYSGASGVATPPVASSNQDGTALNHGGFTTPVADCLLVWTTHIRTVNITANPPGTMNEQCDDVSGTTVGTSISTEIQAAAGASGARNGTKSGTSADATVIMFALIPDVVLRSRVISRAVQRAASW